MKKFLIAISFLLLLLSNVSAEKYALIIAIGDYPEDSGWSDISSENDIPHAKNALLSLGFSEQNISILRDSYATKANIIEAFNKLYVQVGSSDIVVIHFSGHGQQIPDDNQDEIDLLDECIVPYNSPLNYKKGEYEGENLIRDDLLGNLSMKLRKKCGPEGQVLLVLDSCHSGTGIRGFGKTRGTDQIMAPDNFVLAKSSAETSMQVSFESDDSASPMICFYGSGPRELNFETVDQQNNPVGSLTYAFYQILANTDSSNRYEDIFALLRLKMKKLAPYQRPNWEGPQNTTVFGGKIQTKDYFPISKIIDATRLEMNGGTLNEIFDETTVELVESSSGNVIAKGEVTNAELVSSTVSFSEEVSMDPNVLYQIKIVEKSLPTIKTRINSEEVDKQENNNLIGRINNLPFIESSTSNADLYWSYDENKNLTIKDKFGYIIHSVDPNEADSEKMNSSRRAIQAFMQGQFLRSYEKQDPRLDFDVTILLVDSETGEVQSTLDEANPSIPVGTSIKIKVDNNGITGAYFSILDIQPDNVVNLLIPAVWLGYKAEEYFVKSGESYTTDFILDIGEPVGEETLKLIVSKKPQDLHGIITTQGTIRKGFSKSDSFEALLANSYGAMQMKSAGKYSRQEMVGTKTLFFTIVDK